jgi:murein hydrolase activator
LYLYLIVGLLLSLLNYSSTADTLHHKTQQLHKLKQQIHTTRQNLRNATGKRSALETELRHNELAINRHGNNIHKLRQQKKQSRTQLVELNQQLSRLNQKHRLLQHLLAEQIYQAYLFSHHRPMKLLLNTQGPATWQRMLTYQAYLNQSRARTLESMAKTIQARQHYLTKIKQQRFHLKGLEQQQVKQLAQLKQAKQHNSKVLSKLNHGINRQQSRLQRLRDGEKTLAHLIQQLLLTQKAVVEHSFSAQQHRLTWPTTGPILPTPTGKFGRFIQAPPGQAVHAIFAGRVIFADWLKAYGLLIIVQHDANYISLYAHNESLYKNIGDTVSTGDIIAKVGHSGGNHQSGLYFEIRHEGKPVNPNVWCHKRRG